MTQSVLILGSQGKIGSHAATAFAEAGWKVRCFNRATDTMTDAALGVDVIVNGLNPPMYHDWDTLIPAITDQVIEAAQASGATVILPGNVYNFGAWTGEMNEHTPQRPNTRKGAIRVAMEARYKAAGVRTLVLRAGNLIDPNGNGDVMSAVLMRGGTRVTAPGDPNAHQAYAYTPDWARAAVMLAEQRDKWATFEDVPFPGHSFTYSDLLAHVNARTGKSHSLRSFPWWGVTMLSPFIEVARELREMRYLWGLDHWVGAEKFNRLLPDFEATPLATVMDAGLPDTTTPSVAAVEGLHPQTVSVT
ncbi:MAG: epimerase [Paracoccaceae bacterium]